MAVKTKKVPTLKKTAKGEIVPAWRQNVKKRKVVPEPVVIAEKKDPVPPPPEPAPPHVAKQHKVEEIKLPSFQGFGYNWIELPYAVVKTNGEELFFDQLGEADKWKILALHNLIKQGFKIKSMQVTPRNTYLFVLEK